MSASTKAMLFFGAVSDTDTYSRWSNVYEWYPHKANSMGMRMGTLKDGDTTGFYLAIAESYQMVYAGEAIPVKQDGHPQWGEEIKAAAKKLKLPETEPKWHLACYTDRDY